MMPPASCSRVKAPVTCADTFWNRGRGPRLCRIGALMLSMLGGRAQMSVQGGQIMLNWEVMRPGWGRDWEVLLKCQIEMGESESGSSM